MISAQCNLQVKGHERLATSAASEADPRLTRRLVPSTSMPGVVAARMLARRNSSPITHCSTLSRHHSRLPLNIVQDSTLLFSDCSRPCQQLVSSDQRPLLLDTCAIAPPLRPAFFTLSTQQSQLDLTHCPKSVRVISHWLQISLHSFQDRAISHRSPSIHCPAFVVLPNPSAITGLFSVSENVVEDAVDIRQIILGARARHKRRRLETGHRSNHTRKPWLSKIKVS